jgi:hypothetical protein
VQLKTHKECDFLIFKDYLSSNEHLDKDWITVARFDDFESASSFGTFSVLVPNRLLFKIRILRNSDWEQYTSFGNPYFSQSFPSKKICFNVGNEAVQNGISFEAFTILREFHDAFPSRVEIAQNFVLYHGLYLNNQSQNYIEPLSEDIVISYEGPAHVKIKTSYLKDYLAARQMVLVRYHDHRRIVNKPVKSVFGKNEITLKVRDRYRHFSIFIGRGLITGQETISRLLGKDIILPFKEPRHADFLFLAGKERKKYANFLIDEDKNGRAIEETCNEKELSNNFVDRGKVHYLTLTYFKSEVLQKYYENPRRYTVNAGYLHFLDMWGIPFGLNQAGLVHVWLGDLGRLPYEEQLHFREYNVAPSGGVNKEFIQTQLLAKFVETKDLVYTLKKLYREVNDLSQQKIGFKLFQDLSKEDAHIYKTIHEPTTDENKELDEQLISLSKLLTDSIHKSELKAKLSWRPSTPKEDTNILYLEKMLEENFKVQNTASRQIAQPFRNLQRLRSESAAHRKSAQFQEILNEMGLMNKTPQQVFQILVNSLIGALRSIKSVLLEYDSLICAR